MDGGDYGSANGGSPWYHHMLSLRFIDDTHLKFAFEWYRMTGTDTEIDAVFDPYTGKAWFNINDGMYTYTDPLHGQLPSSMSGFTGRIELTEGHVTIFFDDCPACPMNDKFQEWGSFTFNKYSDDPRAIPIANVDQA